MASAPYTIAHCSDIHFGKIAHAEVVPALINDINAHDIDIVAVSGDLTQRARTGEFQAAVAMIEQFDAPALVVPGNHDVYPWWRPYRRLFTPLRKYRRLVQDELAPKVVDGTIAMLGLSSPHGATVKSGRLPAAALDTMRDFFDAHDNKFRVLVVHHHLTRMQELGRHDIVGNPDEALGAAAEARIDLILCGHLHISHIESVDVVPGDHRVVVASAGTATSSRGRKSNRGINFYNVVRVEHGTFSIEERRYNKDAQQFETARTTSFERAGVSS
ncbi:MAG: metallophosphoesterase [Longimonas sp.]|uniref:metallophosphoesterase family protein n=1 Tax=Longimonas sp. TaxID=2039626 RepID=UPI00335DE364